MFLILFVCLIVGLLEKDFNDIFTRGVAHAKEQPIHPFNLADDPFHTNAVIS